MFGWAAAETIGLNHSVLTTSTDHHVGQEIRARLSDAGFITGYETRWKRKDGSLIEVALTLSSVYDEEGNRVGSSAIARDITDLKRLRSEADTERERLLAAQEMAHVGGVEFDYSTGTWWHSEEYARIIGLGPGEQISREKLLSLTHPDDRGILQGAWKSLDEGVESVEYEFRILRHGTDTRWLSSRIRLVHDGNGLPSRFLVTVLDITERKHAESVLEHQAFHDALTGLPNRFLLTRTLQDLLDRECPVVVMFLDVDRFKLVNDGLGHDGGDTILKLFGERLRTVVRKTDTVGRFGGDEFIIICQDLDATATARVAERIRAAAGEGFIVQGRRVFLNVSIGIASSHPGATMEGLLSGADTAMYAAKAGGGDRAEIYDLELAADALGGLDLETDLRLALDGKQMYLQYQPIVEVATGRTTGFETLMRWAHPVHGTIAPDAFIPAAEQTGLIIPLGTWALNEALTQAQQWRQGLPGAEKLSIAVNISVRQLQSPGFKDVLRAALAASGIDPAAVHLEITESVLMEQDPPPLETLKALREQGIRISIDDFGTGYSSLSYLQQLQAQTLKIDRSFVEELGTDPHGATIIELILGTANALSMDVIAEGVETQAQLTELQRLGVPHAQGILWHKPMPTDNVPHWLHEHALLNKRV
jgi:diguanylate cyclase (GGDEF)-like protein/PAS domain S-box-containing protein